MMKINYDKWTHLIYKDRYDHQIQISNKSDNITMYHITVNEDSFLNHFCDQAIKNDLFSILFYPITLEGRRGTTDEFATIPFHLDLFSAALVELAKSIPVHSLILSSHLFFCLPFFLFSFHCAL